MLTVHIVLANESNIYLPGCWPSSRLEFSPLLDLDFNNSSISRTEEPDYALITYPLRGKRKNLCSIVGQTSQKTKLLRDVLHCLPLSTSLIGDRVAIVMSQCATTSSMFFKV